MKSNQGCLGPSSLLLWLKDFMLETWKLYIGIYIGETSNGH